MIKWRFVLTTLMPLLLACQSISLASPEVNIVEADIEALQQAMDKGELTSVQLVKRYLARIEAYDQQNASLNALIRLNPQAIDQAAALDEERKTKGPRSPLHGIPVIVKDNFNTAGLATSAGSIALAGFIPERDAVQVAKLKAAGAIILAKANMDEFAAGASGLSSLGGQTLNPYDVSRSPGGSSAGTAVAITSNFATVGMGTDTCGSIRIPSSFNSLVGFRPSKGIASMSGIIPLWREDDMAGPIARSVKDAAVIIDHTLDAGPEDPATQITQLKDHSGFVAHLGQVALEGLRLGRLTDYFDPNTQSPMNKALSTAISKLEKNGVTVVDVSPKIFDQVFAELERKPPYISAFKADLEAYFQSNPGAELVSPVNIAEQGLYHERLDRYWPFREMVGDSPSPEDTLRKQHWKQLLSEMIEQVMSRHNIDALLYPSVNTIPAKLGESQNGLNCMLSALSGAPAVTLPAGFTSEGLPVGIELLARKFDDKNLMAMAYAIEQTLDARRSPVVTPPLVNGEAPQPVTFSVELDDSAQVKFTFDQTRSTLAYDTQIFSDQEVYAVCLHLSQKGPVIRCLSGIDGRRSSGAVALNAQHRQALNRKELTLRLYSAQSPKGQVASALVFPQ